MKLTAILAIFMAINCSVQSIPQTPTVIELHANYANEEEMESILKEYDEKSAVLCNKNANANFDVQTHVGDETFEKEYEKILLEYAQFRKEEYNRNFKDANPDDYVNESTKRQLVLLKNLGEAALEDDELKELTAARVSMSSVYNSAKICPYNDKNCATPTWSLDKEISDRMAESTDYEELEYVFNEWHDKSGKKMRKDYEKYVEMMNKAAKNNGFEDAGKMWQSAFETPNFEESLDKLWSELEPLYKDLHKYVKNRLSAIYPNKLDFEVDTMPSHIFGNMWAQTWEHLYDKIKPFNTDASIDVTDKMIELGWNAHKLFEMSNEFYMSMGLKNNSISYKVPPAVIEKPDDRIVACHASAWNFCNSSDFRIKMCTQVNQHDFIVIHHEMGHIQYYLQYVDQPLIFKSGANPGFHEAVGDAIALAVSTPKHLQKIDLLDKDYVDSEENQINALFKMALERVAFLPFGYLIDKWRWEVFNGAVKEENWNSRWWELRKKYQKVTPPSTRGEEFFDPGAKYHIPAGSQYISYFIAHVLEFQMYEALCIEAGEYDPSDPKSVLSNCDFFNSKEAGTKLANGLKLGSSKHWNEALKEIIGTEELSGVSLIKYFKPLHEFLKIKNIEFEELKKDLEVFDKEGSVQCNKLNVADWAVNTDVENDTLKEIYALQSAEFAKFTKDNAIKFQKYNPDDYNDEYFKRQIRYITKLGMSALEEDDLKKLTKTISKMSTTYNTAFICAYNDEKCDEKWTLDPEIGERMAKSEDYDELTYIWKEWHDKSGKNIRNDYKDYVELTNRAAVLNKNTDYGDLWREMYEDPDFEKTIDELWDKVSPLYNELHKYVRNKLKKIYGDKFAAEKDLIPAHILGNMWAQSWVNIYNRTVPFENGTLIDVTNALLNQNYNARKMFETADEFYKGLGLEPNDMCYGEKAIIEKPEDKIITCHASAWDFCDGEDFRVKMCTNINTEDFITIHHEMGHIQYYQLYKNLPKPLRDGANPGFHEAVGDLIALSVATPKHLNKIGLLEDYVDSFENNINALYNMALERVAFLPFGLLIDKWRWDVFAEKVKEEEWNKHWWNLREKYQKVSAPITRSEEDFDPGAKFHVPADYKYISYFIAHILEFQLHKSLCIEAGDYIPGDSSKPLHQCDIDKSKKAGEKIRQGLSIGMSKHWSEALKVMTGDEKLSAEAMLEYFNPLLEYLTEVNNKAEAQLAVYNVEAPKHCNKLNKAEWAVNTDMENQELKKELVKTKAEYATFVKEQAEIFKHYEPEDFENEDISRQIKFIKNVGVSALDEEKLNERTRTIASMEEIYNTAMICPPTEKNCKVPTWTLDPDIKEFMAESRDYDDLKYVFEAWHDASGKKMRDLYKTYVDLSNEAANLNKKKDYGELWRESYEDDNFIENVDAMWHEVEELYNELHTYVKNKLAGIHGENINTNDKLIPAHVFGNMWAQSWVNLYNDIKPYESASLVDVTEELKKQGYNALKMFELSNNFYLGLGLESCKMSYTGDSIIEKPIDKIITCHASAWDFCDQNDFRIKMCTSVNMEDFVTIHHEMGHIQYYSLYKNQPIALREGANPGFHEAVGDLIALSVSTPKHLQKIKLLNDYADSEEDNINALFRMALERIAFLPFGLMIDKWRWDVFSGDVKQDQWNKHWWDLREQYQKIAPPSERDETNFDPGSKYHVPADSKYISYFIAHILEFQLHRALCIAANEYDPSDPLKPLHKCDIADSKIAGQKLREGLSIGISRHWSESLKVMTGETEISGKAIMEYFAPLLEFLKEANKSDEHKNEDENSIIPAVIGGVMGGILLVGFIGYGIYYFKFKK